MSYRRSWSTRRQSACDLLSDRVKWWEQNWSVSRAAGEAYSGRHTAVWAQRRLDMCSGHDTCSVALGLISAVEYTAVETLGTRRRMRGEDAAW